MKPASGSSLLPFAVVLASCLAGCAQDLPQIDTVQPNYIQKSSLLGREWYVRSTVVGSSFTNATSFPGAMGSMERGVFEIQENALYFFRTYEFMIGSEAYAQKSDVDKPLLDDAGKPVTHAIPQNYQQIQCKADADCSKGNRCADAKRAGKWPDEEDHAGFCVSLATRYVYRGAPVMAFPITSHFDIRNDYSTATGEKTNKRLENTTDRKWYDRDFMRVSWGAQQLTDYATNPLPSAAAVVFEGDTAPEGEQFETGAEKTTGAGGAIVAEQQYMSYVYREIHASPSVHFEGVGDVPLCLFPLWATGGVKDCASEEFKIRMFFLEVPKFADPSRAYVAREQDDVEMEKFGFFRTERSTYDIQFGNSFHNAVRRTQRHRVWDRYVKKLETDGSWKGDFDYAQMTPVPIVYYLNDDHPRELVPASVDIAHSWSPAFEDVVKFRKPGFKLDHAMFVLCENSDASAKAALDAGAKYAEGEVVEHGKIGTESLDAAVKAGKLTAAERDVRLKEYAATPDAKFCRHMDKPHAFGDLRYSFMHALPAPSQNSLYGYGPSAADPLTGEIIAASAHAYTNAMKQGAEAALQALEFQAGITDFNDVERASQKKYVVGARAAVLYDRKGPKSLTEVQAAVAGMMDPDVRSHLQSSGLTREDNGGSYAQGRMARLQQNPQMDAMLAGDDEGHSIQALFRTPGLKPGVQAVVNPSDLKTLSLASWAHTAGLRSRQKVFEDLAIKTMHFNDFTDGALVGLAQEYGAKYDSEMCKAYASAPGTLFTALDGQLAPGQDACPTPGAFESMGPSKGRICLSVGAESRWATCSTAILMQSLRLAINQANGGDPNAALLNSLPGPLYWDTLDPVLRKTQEVGRAVVDKLRKDIKLQLWQHIYEDTQMHEVGHTLGLRHNFEASTDSLNFHKEFWDLKLDDTAHVVNPLQPDTPAQGAGHIREKQLASVMDYTSKFNGRFAGIGLYDKAAIRFGYGDMVEAYSKPPELDKPLGDLPRAKDFLATPADTHPETTMTIHQGNQDMYKLTRRIHYSSWPRYFGKDKATAIANMYDRTFIAWRDVKGDRCTVDADCGSERKCQAIGEDSYCAKAELSAGVPLVEVPYRFCSDEYNGQTPSCSTFDEGVDSYEIARNALDDYEQYWSFWGYARDNEMFYPDNYFGRVQRQFYTAVRQFQYWAIDFATYQKDGWWKARYGKDYDQDINGGLAGGFGAMNTFNVLAQVMARPSPGYYYYNAAKGWLEQYNAVDQANVDAHFLDEPQGARPLYAGYGGGYLYRPLTAGQIYDRIAAISLLSDPTTSRYIGVNETEDARRYLVSFFTIFPRQTINLFAGIQVDDANHFGWYLLQGKRDGAGQQLEPDAILKRDWVGPTATQLPPKCTDVASLPLDQQTGCLKYVIYPDARPFFPSSRFRMPLLGALYGMAFLTKGFDRTFMDLSRVFMAGNQNQIEIPSSVAPEDIAKFTDPLSGKTYVATKVSQDVLNPAFIAVQQAAAELAKFKDLKTLQDTYLFSDYQYRVSLLEAIRSLHETYEY
jgi:hypothetical protein